MIERLKKVPEITAYFWTIKILSTAMGEALSDFLVNTINPVYAVSAAACGLAIALYIQLRSNMYTPWKYWLTVSMVAIFGTMAADVLHVGLGVSYIESSIGFAVILLLIFIVWFRTEKTLSIHSIKTMRKEVFYWTTVGATFAFGTSIGDLTANTLNLGYLLSGILFAFLILIPLFAYYKLGLKEVVAFWIAYILTRPLGASFADWFGKSHQVGGVGLGDGTVAVFLIVLIVFLVTATSYKSSQNEKPRRASQA